MKYSSFLAHCFCAVPFLAFSHHGLAEFVAFENFDALATGPLNGQNGWTGNPGASIVGGTDKAAVLNTGGTGTLANSHPISIPTASTAATIYWNFTISSAAVSSNNWRFGLGEAASPADLPVEMFYDSEFGSPLRIHRGISSTTNLSLDGTSSTRFSPLIDVQYDVWFEINNSAGLYKIFIQSSGDSRVTSRTPLLDDVGGRATFGFFGRVIVARDLTKLNFSSSSGASIVQFDDIYADMAGINSSNPAAIPEPSAALLGLSGLALILRRRRRQ